MIPNTEFVDFRTQAIKSGGNPAVYSMERILVRQIGEYPDGCLCPPKVFTMNTIYNIYLKNKLLDIKYILGIINSKIIHYFWKNKFSDSKKTFPKIKKRPLESIPIAVGKQEHQKLLIDYVNRIIGAKSTNNSADTNDLEDKSRDSNHTRGI